MSRRRKKPTNANGTNGVHYARSDGGPSSTTIPDAPIKPPRLDVDLPFRLPPGAGRAIRRSADAYMTRYQQWFSNTYLNPDEAYQQSKDNQAAMRRDPVIMEPLRMRQLACALMEWQIVPEDENDKEQKTFCSKLERIFKRIPNFLKLRMALLEAIWFGKYAVNCIYQYDDYRTDELSVVDWLPFHGDKIKFDMDSGQAGILMGRPRKDREIRMSDEATVSMLQDWERQAFVIHKHEIEDGEFREGRSAGSIHGIGLRTRVYWSWFFKQKLLQWMMEYCERIGLGLTIFYFDPHNPEQEERIKELSEEYNNEATIRFPRSSADAPGPGIERIEPGAGGSSFFKEILDEYYGSQIKRMILGQTLTSEAHATGLGSGVAKEHGDTRDMIAKFDAINLEETITREMLWVVAKYTAKDLNWRPRFEFVKEKDNPRELMEAAKAFIEMGGEVGENDLREIAGLPRPQANDKILGQSAEIPGMGGPDQGGMPQIGPGQQSDYQEEPSNPWGQQFSKRGQPQTYAEWKEQDHPRADDGRFGDKPGQHDHAEESIPTQSSAANQWLDAIPQKFTETTKAGKQKESTRFTLPNGSQLPAHVAHLRIPPAWTNVRIASDPNAGLLVTGFDAKGRRQSVYSDSHTMQAAAAKFSRITTLMGQIDRIRSQITAGMQSPDRKTSEAATVMRLIESMGLRPGSDNDTGAEKQAYGATTLQADHVVQDPDGSVRLKFVGKKGVDLDLPVTDPDVAKVLLERKQRGGRLFNVSDSELRDFAHTLGSGEFKPKDFRTLKGTSTAAEMIAGIQCCQTEKEYKKSVMEVARVVASKLGNTPTIALQSYINPTVFSKWRTAA